jgi:hypothetical protein
LAAGVLERLRPLLGEWTIQVTLAGAEDMTGRMVFEPMLGGAFVAQRSEAPDPIPDGFCIISAAAEGDGFIQHYFDSRGVVRVYAMTFEDGVWTLFRDRPDFTPLSFSQRFTGKLSDDGRVIRGLIERTDDVGEWIEDFGVTYTRVG